MWRWACILLVLTCYVQLCWGQSPTDTLPETSRSVDFVLTNGHYWESSSAFGQDCTVQCDADTVLYDTIINTTQTLQNAVLQAYGYSDEVENVLDEMHGTWEWFQLQQNVTLSWNATRCTQCDSLRDPNTNTTIGYAMYSMDQHCTPSCYNHFGYYNLPAFSNTCVYCDLNNCDRGKYLSANCTDKDCKACTLPAVAEHGNWNFTTPGLIFNDSSSCKGECENGFYSGLKEVNDKVVEACLPWSIDVVDCSINEYFVGGSSLQDAYCEKCTSTEDCEGLHMVSKCTLTEDAICLPCDSTLSAGKRFHGVECAQMCLDGFVLNYELDECEACTHVCDPGTHFTQDRQRCADCRSCAVTLPDNAMWTLSCSWDCTDGFELRGTECVLVQDIISSPLPTLVLCEVNQQLSDDGVQCVACNDVTTIVRPFANEGITWTWKKTHSRCTWECLPGYFFVQVGSAVDCYVWSEFEQYMLHTLVLHPYSVHNITFLKSSTVAHDDSTETKLPTIDFFVLMLFSMLGLITLMCSFK